MIKHNVVKIALAFAMAGLVGCGVAPVEKDPQFEYTRALTYKSLELPPDLTIELDEQFAIPGVDGLDNAVPDYKNAQLHRQGDKVWLSIEGNAALVWKRLHEFLRLQGMDILNSDQLAGTITTVWMANKTGIAVGDLIDNIQAEFISSNYMDQYLLSVERSGSAGQVKVFVYHRGRTRVHLKDNGASEVTEQWIERPSDPALQIALIKKFMAYSGLSDMQIKQGFDAGRLKELFSAKVIKQVEDESYLIVRRSPQLVFDELSAASFSLFNVEKIKESSHYLVVNYPYISAKKKKANEGKSWYQLDNDKTSPVRIQVVSRGYDSKIILRDEEGDLIEADVNKEILNKLYAVL